MIDKEETSRTIFGIARADGSVLNSLTNEQETAILRTLALIDVVDKIYDQQGGAAPLATAFGHAKERYEEILAILPDKDLKTRLLATTLKAYEAWITLTIGAELNQFQGDATGSLAAARMRKVFLRKI